MKNIRELLDGGGVERSPLAAVFHIELFRGIWIAGVLAGIAIGTSRFAFSWPIGDLTNWDPAVTDETTSSG